MNPADFLRRFYDARATTYLEGLEAFAHHLDRTRAFLREHVRPGMRVLDVGCGPAPFTAELPEGVQVTGVDLSPKMLEQAAARRPSGHYFVHDFHDPLPSPLGLFDVVIAAGCFDFCRDLGRVIGHLGAALRPGGFLFCTVNERRAAEQPDPKLDVKTPDGDVSLYFWTSNEAEHALRNAWLVPADYAYGDGWYASALNREIRYAYWISERVE